MWLRGRLFRVVTQVYWVIFSILMLFPFEMTEASSLEQKLNQLAEGFDGRIGICAAEISDSKNYCLNGNSRFQLQSVMKLVASAAAMDAIDRKRHSLSELVDVRLTDISPGPEHFAELIRKNSGLSVTIEELITRAIVDSDSTSIDALIRHLGGIATVQDFLSRKQLFGLRVDRTERDLQSQSVGLIWQTEYADLKLFERGVQSLSENTRDRAWQDHLHDERDTASPVGMADFLKKLASGKILSRTSTEKLLEIMKKAETGKDRLRAGLPAGWALAHKTGTGRTWKGMRAAVNDVGVIISPTGRMFAIAAFVAESHSSDVDQAARIARATSFVVDELSVKSERH